MGLDEINKNLLKGGLVKDEQQQKPIKAKKVRIGKNEIGRYDPVTKQWIWRN
jgi:hypothetical protein